MSSHNEAYWTRIRKYFTEPDLFSNLPPPSFPPPAPHPAQRGVEETADKCRKLGAVVHVFVVDCSNRAEIYNSVDQVRTRVQVSHQLTLSWETKRWAREG